MYHVNSAGMPKMFMGQASAERIVMKYFSVLAAGVLATIVLFCPGCSRDPNVRKQKYLESGERYFAKAQYSAAAIQFGNAIQADAGDATAHYQLARTYLKLQNWPKGYKELTRTLDLQPGNYEARLDLANLLIAGGDLKQAQAEVQLLSEKRPDDPQVHLALAHLRTAQENFPDAIQELQKVIALEPAAGGPYLDLGVLQLKTNQFDSAETSFKKAINCTPKAITPRLALGSYYQSRRHFSEAEQEFRDAIEIERHNPDPRAALARLYLVEGKKADAENLLEESKKDFPNNSAGYRMLGDFYFATGELDNAATEYGILNRDHPKDIQVTKNYVQILILDHRLAEAQKLNDVVLKARPNEIDALIERGEIQIANGHSSDAISTLQTAIKNGPDNGLAYYHLGVANEHLGNLVQAERAWQDAVRRLPTLVEAQRSLALVALREGNMADLEQYSSQMIGIQPASPEGYTLRAVSYIRRSRLPQGESDVLKAIEVAPQNAIGYVQMGNLRLAQKKYAEAEHAYQQALDRDGSSVDALAGLMNTYLAQNQINNALVAVRAQIVKVPDSSSFYDLLGTALFDHKQTRHDLDEAEASLEKSVQIDNKNTDASLKLSQILAASGSTDEALSTCQRALDANPGEVSFYVLIGQIQESKKNWDKAKEAYQKALQINPQDPLASNNLAYVMLQTGGNPDLAMPLAEMARRVTPDSPQAADTMGWVFYNKGAYKSAIDLFEEALKLEKKGNSPDNPTVHFHLGLAYQSIGEAALARQHLQRVLKLDPGYSNADDVRKLLFRLRG
jgi:cellulose synthase operon protein C